MMSYLKEGWYLKRSRSRLRNAVINGAIDIAGILMRCGVPAHRVLRIALKVRTLVVISDPLLLKSSQLKANDRDRIKRKLEIYTDNFPELQTFVNDCLDHIHNAADMTAFYLHLVHITRMMQLLSHAIGPDLPFFNEMVCAKSSKTSMKKKVSQGTRASMKNKTSVSKKARKKQGRAEKRGKKTAAHKTKK